MGLYHQILNVSENATEEEIRKQYLSLCKKHHPDLNDNIGTEKMALINEAYFSLIGNKRQTVSAMNTQNNHRGLVEYKDQAYAFYKQGYKFYLSTDLNMSRENQYHAAYTRIMFSNAEEIDSLRSRILQALYYFNIICVQYPQSPWLNDSLEKMSTLNRRLLALREEV